MEQDGQVGAKAGEEMAWHNQTRGGGRTIAPGRDKFPVLTAMAGLLRIVGLLAVAGGVFLAVSQVAPWFACMTANPSPPAQMGGFGAASCGGAILILAPMLGSFAVGFCLIAFGESIAEFERSRATRTS